MLLDDVTKAYVVCYCDPSGSGNSACTKCKEVGIQKNCSFFVKSTVMDSCSNLRYDRYCNCFYASDFVNGKDVHIENIPNLPKKDNQTRMTPKTFIDTPYGLREIKGPPTRREIYREFVSPYPWEMQKVVKKVQGIDRHEKMHEQVLASDQIDDHYADMSEVMGDYEEWQDKKGKTMCKHCNVIFCAEPCPKYLNSDITLGVDTSGSMTPESFQELANMVAEQLTNQTLTWTRPINTFMDMSELRELMDGLCCAYSHKYGLYLDMSDLDIYTIYKRDGYFIDLRSLYKDGIFPMDLNFKMIDGRNQEDVDFLPFLEMVPKMLNSGR
jgi:hypothetical protein